MWWALTASAAWAQQAGDATLAGVGALDVARDTGPLGLLAVALLLLGRALGQGVSLRLEVTLAEPERELLRRGVEALERAADGDEEVTASRRVRAIR